jgi:O-antigen ligase
LSIRVPVIDDRSASRPQVHDPRTADAPRTVLVAIGIGITSLPLLLPSIAGNLTPADAAFLIGIALTLMWAGTARLPLRVPYALGVSVFVLAGVVSGLAGAFPGLALLAVVQDLYLLVWATALVTVARTAYALDIVLRTWAVGATVWAIVFVLATTGTAASSDSASRAGFTFGEQNGAGLYFALSLFVVLAARRPRRTLLRVAAVAVLSIAILYTGSLGALSGLFLGLAIAVVLSVRSRRGPVQAVAITLCLLLFAGSVAIFAEQSNVVAAAHQSENPLIRNSLGRGDQSTTERETINRETSGLLVGAGVWGVGAAATKNVLVDRQAPYAKQAHNDWLAAFVERGVLGLLGIVLLVAEIVHRAAQAWDPRRSTTGTLAAVPSPALLVGSLGVVLVFSLTHEVLHDRTLWTLLGVIAAVAVSGRAPAEEELGVRA